MEPRVGEACVDFRQPWELKMFLAANTGPWRVNDVSYTWVALLKMKVAGVKDVTDDLGKYSGPDSEPTDPTLSLLQRFRKRRNDSTNGSPSKKARVADETAEDRGELAAMDEADAEEELEESEDVPPLPLPPPAVCPAEEELLESALAPPAPPSIAEELMGASVDDLPELRDDGQVKHRTTGRIYGRVKILHEGKPNECLTVYCKLHQCAPPPKKAAVCPGVPELMQWFQKGLELGTGMYFIYTISCVSQCSESHHILYNSINHASSQPLPILARGKEHQAEHKRMYSDICKG